MDFLSNTALIFPEIICLGKIKADKEPMCGCEQDRQAALHLIFQNFGPLQALQPHIWNAQRVGYPSFIRAETSCGPDYLLIKPWLMWYMRMPFHENKDHFQFMLCLPNPSSLLQRLHFSHWISKSRHPIKCR